MDRIVKRVNQMALASEHLAVAAALLYEAECGDEMIACHTLIDCLKYDIAELTNQHFPVVTKR